MRKVIPAVFFFSCLFAAMSARSSDFDVIRFDSSPKALTPFNVEITLKGGGEITVKSVRFNMDKMNMGNFTFIPVKNKSGYVVEKVTLPPCRTKDKRWFMEISYTEGGISALKTEKILFELE